MCCPRPSVCVLLSSNRVCLHFPVHRPPGMSCPVCPACPRLILPQTRLSIRPLPTVPTSSQQTRWPTLEEGLAKLVLTQLICVRLSIRVAIFLVPQRVNRSRLQAQTNRISLTRPGPRLTARLIHSSPTRLSAAPPPSPIDDHSSNLLPNVFCPREVYQLYR